MKSFEINDADSHFGISKQSVAGCIDHTILKPEATEADITRLCREAAEYGFAAVCVNPVYVPLAVEILGGTNVNVCTVIGFPLGVNSTEVKVYEARLAVLQGASEIDMVIRVGAVKEGRLEIARQDIAEVVRGARSIKPDVIVKVIIETCLLTDSEKVTACQLAESAGADFVKTSTGFSSGGALVSDVALMKNSIGSSMRIKASGGIRSAAEAISFIKAGAARIGTSSGIKIIEELENT